MKQLNRKTWIIIGSAVAGVAVIAAVLLGLYFAVWAQPSKQDFEAASKTAKEISNTGASKELTALVTKANQEIRAGKVQPALTEAVAAEKKKVDDLVAKRATLNETLKGSIVQRDEEIKKSYDTYVAQEAKYSRYMTGYAASYPYYRSSLSTCLKPFQINDKVSNDVTKYAALHKEASVDCYEDLDLLLKSSIKPIADYGKEFKRIIGERQKVFDQLEEKTLDTSKAGARIKELGNDFTKNDPTQGLQDAVKDAGFNGELDKLIKLLDDKAKAAK